MRNPGAYSLGRRSEIIVSPIGDIVLFASTSRRKYTRPESSPTILVRPSGAKAQLFISLSPERVTWAVARPRVSLEVANNDAILFG
jgi:hypothetical protein